MNLYSIHLEGTKGSKHEIIFLDETVYNNFPITGHAVGYKEIMCIITASAEQQMRTISKYNNEEFCKLGADSQRILLTQTPLSIKQFLDALNPEINPEADLDELYNVVKKTKTPISEQQINLALISKVQGFLYEEITS